MAKKKNSGEVKDELQERRAKIRQQKLKNMDIIDLLMENIKSLRQINKSIYERMDLQDKMIRSLQERMDYLENR